MIQSIISTTIMSSTIIVVLGNSINLPRIILHVSIESIIYTFICTERQSIEMKRTCQVNTDT